MAVFTVLRVMTSAHKGGPISRPATPTPAGQLLGTPRAPQRGPLRPLLAGGHEGHYCRWTRRNRQLAVFPVFSAKLAAAADFTYYFKIIAPTK